MNIQVSKPTSSSVLRIEGLLKQFEMHRLKRALYGFDNISIEVSKGENGAGKTTLLRTLCQSYLPRAGQVFYHTGEGTIDLASAGDVDIAVPRRREITEFLNARPRVAAEDLVAEPLRPAGTPHSEAIIEARRWLSTFVVKKQLWEAYPSKVAGGEQQKNQSGPRTDPAQRLLLLDEPTASLDRDARKALVTRLADLKAAGVAMIGVFRPPGRRSASD